jgi:glutaredoxin
MTAVKTNPSKISDVKVYRMSMPEHECPWGLRAVNLLEREGIDFEEIKLRSRQEVEDFKAKHHVSTTPQIFFGEERVGGYTDLAERFDDITEMEEKTSYTPVIAVFSTAGLMTLALSLGMTGFMGISLSMLASLKLMDLDAFAESFQKYDLITQRFKPYRKVYPFAELLVGLGFLSGIVPLVTGAGSLLIGLNGAISVFRAVYIDKMDLNCACVGGNSKAPLGVVSFTENAIMVLMGAFLIFSAFGNRTVDLSPRSQVLSPATVQMQTLQNR